MSWCACGSTQSKVPSIVIEWDKIRKPLDDQFKNLWKASQEVKDSNGTEIPNLSLKTVEDLNKLFLGIASIQEKVDGIAKNKLSTADSDLLSKIPSLFELTAQWIILQPIIQLNLNTPYAPNIISINNLARKIIEIVDPAFKFEAKVEEQKDAAPAASHKPEDVQVDFFVDPDFI